MTTLFKFITNVAFWFCLINLVIELINKNFLYSFSWFAYIVLLCYIESFALKDIKPNKENQTDE